MPDGETEAGDGERVLDLDPDDDPHVDKYDGEPVDNVRPYGPVYLVDVKGDTILVAGHEIVERPSEGGGDRDA